MSPHHQELRAELRDHLRRLAARRRAQIQHPKGFGLHEGHDDLHGQGARGLLAIDLATEVQQALPERLLRELFLKKEEAVGAEGARRHAEAFEIKE